MDDIDAVLAKLDKVQRADEEAKERARIQREAREHHESLWCSVRYGAEPGADNLIQLASAIAQRHKDGSLAVQRLADKYLADSERGAPPDFIQAHKLKVLAAKLGFCHALIEAGKPDPDKLRILDLFRRAVGIYEYLDAEDVRQDLYKAEAANQEALPLPEMSAATSAETSKPQSDAPSVLPKILHGWSEILTSIGMRNDSADMQKVRHLAKQVDGCPICFGSTGQRPLAVQSALLAWWQRAADSVLEAAARRQDTAETVADTYKHGGATVVPEIGGHVRRSKKVTKGQ